MKTKEPDPGSERGVGQSGQLHTDRESEGNRAGNVCAGMRVCLQKSITI